MSSPAVMVPPERETPGIRASAWARPNRMPSRTDSSVSSLRWGAKRSANPSRIPKRISIVAVMYRFRRLWSIWSSKRSPSTPIGIEPRITSQPIRA